MPPVIPEIFTVNAFTGVGGKTYNAIRVAVAATRGAEKYILCVPSTKLAIQVENDCRAAGCQAATAIHTADGYDEPVVARITAHFKLAAPEKGEILIITMAALERLKYIERRGLWHLIVDEIPTPVFHDAICLHENRNKLTDLFDEQPYNAAYSRLQTGEAANGHVMEVAQNRFGDEMTQRITEVANKLLGEHWHCFALNDQLAKFRTPGGEKRVLDVFGLLQPSIFAGFKSVTLMGACLDETLLYRHWLSLGVAFAPHPVIKPRMTDYPNGGLVTIHYAIDRDWSAKMRDTAGVLDNILERAKLVLNGEPYVYLANKGKNYPALCDGVQLPHVSHGLNTFQGFHNAVLLSALNPPPAYFGFCSDLMNLTSDEVKSAIYRTSTLQAATRTSIRDLDNGDKKKFVVVDKAMATWLATIIANSTIAKMPGIDPAPDDRRRVEAPKTNAERDLAYRQKIKADLIAGLDEVNKNPTDGILKGTLKDSVSRVHHVGNIFWSIRDEFALSTKGVSVNSLRNLLAELHSETVAAKTDRPLISPGSYNPNLSDNTCRGTANIVSMSGIWMDNDGGDLSPDDFAKMLKVPLVIFNSFNSTIDAPRWRVWIPTSHLITPEVHKEIIAQICKMLIDRKFYGAKYIAKHPDRPVKNHGFDEGKFASASLFYLPAQAKVGNEASFFDEHHWDKPLLNPYQWIDRSIVDHRPPVILQPVQAPLDASEIGSRTVNEAKLEKAIQNWQGHSHHTGNQAYFTLGVACRHAGLSRSDWDSLMRSQAHYAHGTSSVAERLMDLKRFAPKIWR